MAGASGPLAPSTQQVASKMGNSSCKNCRGDGIAMEEEEKKQVEEQATAKAACVWRGLCDRQILEERERSEEGR